MKWHGDGTAVNRAAIYEVSLSLSLVRFFVFLGLKSGLDGSIRGRSARSENNPISVPTHIVVYLSIDINTVLYCTVL